MLHTVWDQLYKEGCVCRCVWRCRRSADLDCQLFHNGREAMKCLFVGARSSTLVAATMLATYEEAGNMFSSLIGSAVGSRVPAPSAPADCGASSGVSPAVSGTGGGSAPHH
jgi:hypothetical protein